MIIKPFKLSQRSMLSFPDNNGQSSRRIIAISFDYQVFAAKKKMLTWHDR